MYLYFELMENFEEYKIPFSIIYQLIFPKTYYQDQLLPTYIEVTQQK